MEESKNRKFKAVEIIVLLFSFTIVASLLVALGVVAYSYLLHVHGVANPQEYEPGERSQAIMFLLDSMLTVVIMFVGYSMKETFRKT